MEPCTEGLQQIVNYCSQKCTVHSFKRVAQGNGTIGCRRDIKHDKRPFLLAQNAKRHRTFCDEYVWVSQEKKTKQVCAPILNIESTHPFQLVSVDFLQLEECRGGYEYILVVMDHYTRFAQAVSQKSCTMTWGENLRISCTTWKHCLVSRGLILVPITPKGTDRQSVSTEPPFHVKNTHSPEKLPAQGHTCL